MADNGVLWSIRYYGQKDGEIKMILAKEIDRVLDEFEADGKDWTSADLADALVTDLDAKPSGAAEIAVTPERVRKVVAHLDPAAWPELTDEGVVASVLKADQEARKGA